jgi:hypothetical protein
MPTRGILLIATTMTAACVKSPEQKAKQAAETIRSWHATVAAIDSARARKTVPEHFARDVRRAADQEIQKATAQAK